MNNEKPIIDYQDSIERGTMERKRQEHLIARSGGIISYLTGPRYFPPDQQHGIKEPTETPRP